MKNNSLTFLIILLGILIVGLGCGEAKNTRDPSEMKGLSAEERADKRPAQQWTTK
jgi:hypothetical protein